MTTKELLIAARRRIANGWTKDESARDANGNPVGVHHPCAVSFCLFGAIRAAARTQSDMSALYALGKALPNPPYRNYVVSKLTKFNDDPDTTQDDVLALYDRAIERQT